MSILETVLLGIMLYLTPSMLLLALALLPETDEVAGAPAQEAQPEGLYLAMYGAGSSAESDGQTER
jgi:hypothetical protein